ncbi:Protein of unknown function [Peptoclostridium litorale DSM 5388]|uniref:DUF3160 domain-containing protein n=1 Tax=Peptoclostridium litorale DSM 5388 TaxID=1121324 RepID=A0A069RDA4_PEPLI|nr:DUF3160 domain-containing protein [Peptoclostridium litorale]KDR94210.1 hypothetical protein CLIT_23c04830 [Peptoclostridium litorale DSM 5388]SIN82339.1 Protein of unknown function [Peptoclostridium litorale DSM 5388]
MISRGKGLACMCLILVAIVTATGCAEKDIHNENAHAQKSLVKDGTNGGKAAIADEKNSGDLVKLSNVEKDWARTIDIPFEKTQFTPSLKPYAVKGDLSNIANLDQFPQMSTMQREMLVENGFFVRPTLEEQLFYIYEHNEYKKIPTFVTTDSVLQVYHVFYDYSLRTLESKKLLDQVEELTGNMLQKSIEMHNRIKDEQVKGALLKNIAFFGTAELLLQNELPSGMPEKAKAMAKSEADQILSEGGFERSNIFPYQLDYSQYRPRGHYTRSEDLKRYFKAMMWYGQAPFPLYKDKEEKEPNVEQTLQALLITYASLTEPDIESDDENDFEKWKNIYEPTSFYVGAADDLNIRHYKDLLVGVYGSQPDIERLIDSKKLDELFKKAKYLPSPKIQAKYTSVDTPVGKQFRFMGQRYIPDSEIIQNMVEPLARPIPNGLDVMAALGSYRAYSILTEFYNEDTNWDGYIPALEKMKREMDSTTESTWKSNMYYGWLWTLKGFLTEYEEGYPSFMTNEAWTDKALGTALGSWSELKHDTVLYGKQSGAECGGGEEPPQIKGYVEPSIEVYEKLLWLNRYSRANLKERGFLDGTVESRLQDFDDLLEFLIRCSVKELEGEELTSDEYYQLLTYGGMLEYLTSSFAGDGDVRWFEITSETDKNMAVISDVHTVAPNQFSQGGYFEVGVGPAHEIYVVVPIGDKLYITRGAVFSYHEFLNEGKRLTDEEWQDMIKEGEKPSQPEWMKRYMVEDDLEIPVPAEPYSSGC